MRTLTKEPLSVIGEKVGLDHSTVVYSLKYVKTYFRFNKELEKDYYELKNLLLDSGYNQVKRRKSKLRSRLYFLEEENELLKDKLFKLNSSKESSLDLENYIYDNIKKVHESNMETFKDKFIALCELNKHEIRRR